MTTMGFKDILPAKNLLITQIAASPSKGVEINKTPIKVIGSFSLSNTPKKIPPKNVLPESPMKILEGDQFQK